MGKLIGSKAWEWRAFSEQTPTGTHGVWSEMLQNVEHAEPENRDDVYFVLDDDGVGLKARKVNEKGFAKRYELKLRTDVQDGCECWYKIWLGPAQTTVDTLGIEEMVGLLHKASKDPECDEDSAADMRRVAEMVRTQGLRAVTLRKAREQRHAEHQDGDWRVLEERSGTSVQIELARVEEPGGSKKWWSSSVEGRDLKLVTAFRRECVDAAAAPAEGYPRFAQRVSGS